MGHFDSVPISHPRHHPRRIALTGQVRPGLTAQPCPTAPPPAMRSRVLRCARTLTPSHALDTPTPGAPRPRRRPARRPCPHQCPCVSRRRGPYTCGRYSHRSALVTTASCSRGGTYEPVHSSSATCTRWPTSSATPCATRARDGPWLDRAIYATPASSREPRADAPLRAPVASSCPSSSRIRTSRPTVSYMSYRRPHFPLLAYT